MRPFTSLRRWAWCNLANPTNKGKELEDYIEAMAKKYGWRVEKRKKYGNRIVDILLRKKGIALVVQCKNTERASPQDVSQTRRDYDEFVRYLLEEKLGLLVRPILVSKDFSPRSKRRARSYGVMLYTVEELEKFLSYSKKDVNRKKTG